jgi:uncharacterized membrane protein YfcA
MSLVAVASALPFRAGTVPFAAIADHRSAIVNLLAGSLIGAWFAAGRATRLKSETLYKVIAALLVLIAIVLMVGHDAGGAGRALITGPMQIVAGVIAGFAIGVLAALLGVAGGELLIPTLLLLFGADIKLAGSLSLAVSLPTMLIGFARYSRDRSFAVLGRNRSFTLVMAAGSIVGSFIGGRLLGFRTRHRSAAAARRDPADFGRESVASPIACSECRQRMGIRSRDAGQECRGQECRTPQLDGYG